MYSPGTAPSLPVDDDGKRIAHRHKIFLPVRMTAAQDELRIHLINLSTTGALAHHAKPPVAGQAVMLDLEGRQVRGRVVWVAAPRFGIAFAERLDERTIDALFGR